MTTSAESRRQPGAVARPSDPNDLRRAGLGWWESQSAYHTALAMSCPKFLLTSTGIYLAINIVFAIAYLACGTGALAGVPPSTLGGPLGRAFFFSIETFATIGYGNISPVGVLPHAIMVVESLTALMSQALITGLLFARFARPTVAIRFSRQMVMAPYRGGRGLMFRVVNKHENYEFIVLLTGTDQTFAQPVNSRTSYRADEIVWGAKFRNIFNPPDAKGILSVDVHRLDETDPAPLPDAERVPA